MKEYWKNPEAMRKAFRGDWYFTGDRTYRDEEGYFWFVGRDKELIKTAALTIAPLEVEKVLLEHSSVMEAAVVGIPNGKAGEKIKAFVTLKTSIQPSEKLSREILQYVAGNLSMRLRGVHAFDAFPMVVRSGGMLQAFGPPAGRKVVHPETGETTILCEGFDRKNHDDRETPCDPDFLRKVVKDTDAQALMRWFGEEVVRAFQRRGVFDPEGVFIGGASYLFVPDNPRYEGSVCVSRLKSGIVSSNALAT